MARVIKNIFQLRRGLHDKWIEENPILSEGEPAFETDTFHLKIGDGKTAYQALPYIGEDWSEGKDGTGIESITYKGEDESGGNIYTVLLTDGTSYDITAPKGAKGDKGDAGGSGQAVLYTEQSLTEDQQTQALENIRAVDKYNGLKRYDVEYQNSRGVTIKNTIYTNGVLTQPEELSTETEIGMAWARFNSWLGLTLSINPSSESYYIKAIAAIADFGCFGNDFWETTSDTSRIFTKTPEKLPDRYTCIYSYSADTKTIWAKKYYETSRYEVGYSIKTNKFTNYAIYFGTPIQPTAVKADAIPDVMQFQMKTDPTSDMQVATKKYVDDTVAQAGGGTDLSLSLTNATVGQIAKITAVDDDGAPTAWEPVDMPSGGGETWEKIADVPLTADVSVYTLANMGTYRKVIVMLTRDKYVSGLNKNVWLRLKKGADIFYTIGYLAAEYGYVSWSAEVEVNDIFITSRRITNNNPNSTTAVQSSGNQLVGDVSPAELAFALEFVDTSVIQTGDTVTVLGAKR